MKYDCPNCGQSLKSHRFDPNDFARGSKGFDCPHCGSRVRVQFRAEELVGVLFIVLSLWSTQFFVDTLRAFPVWVRFAVALIVILIVFVVVKYLVRGKQRYAK